MARSYIRVGIKALAPFRIGDWDRPEKAAQQVRTIREPGTNRAWVPGTGLAGSLRSHIIRHGGESQAINLLGGELTVSPWRVLGTVMVGEHLVIPRGQTPISRSSRAAASRGYRTCEEVQPLGGQGPDLYLYLASELDPTAMLAALSTWRPTLGGSITSGLGDAEISTIHYRTLSYSDPVELLALIDHDGTGSGRIDALLREGSSVEVKGGGTDLALRVTCQVDDLLAPDDTDQAVRNQWAGAPWFHGSAWKGVLRSRVEYIANCLELITCARFGGSRSGDDRHLASKDSWTGCGHCAICAAFGSAESGQGYWAFSCSTETHDEDSLVDRTRVAIDRFTGGARDKALFNEATMAGHRLNLVITWARPLDENDHGMEWVARALVRALGDLNEGIIGLGGRTSTGLGRVRIISVELGDRPAVGDRPATSLIAGYPRGTLSGDDLATVLGTLNVKEAADD